MTHRTHTAAELIKKELAGLTNGVLRPELGGRGGVEQQDEEEAEEEPDHGLVVLRHRPHRALRRRRRRRPVGAAHPLTAPLARPGLFFLLELLEDSARPCFMRRLLHASS